MAVETVTVSDEAHEQRLDRWFKRRYPQVTQGQLQKLLRTGQVRVDGKRAQAATRLETGARVRVPPLPDAPTPAPMERRSAPRGPSRADDTAFMRDLVLHEDGRLIVLNKPSGLAVQGGSKTTRHIDGLLPALAQEGERLRLVHRLDRDTSGLLVVARDEAAARDLTGAFRGHSVRKLYWALVSGKPPLSTGEIKLRLDKLPGAVEKVAVTNNGKRSVTRYVTVAGAGKLATWLALYPLTGRTHQLRVHAAEGLGTPIFGDGKYGGGAARRAELPDDLMLHARRVSLPHPNGGYLTLDAPAPGHFTRAMAVFGFAPDMAHEAAGLLDEVAD